MSLTFNENDIGIGSFTYGPIYIHVLGNFGINVAINNEKFEWKYDLIKSYDKINSVLLGAIKPTDKIKIFISGDGGINNDIDLDNDLFSFWVYSNNGSIINFKLSYSENKIELNKYFTYLLNGLKTEIELERNNLLQKKANKKK